MDVFIALLGASCLKYYGIQRIVKPFGEDLIDFISLRKKLMSLVVFFFPLLICLVADHLGCDPQTRFFVPPNIKQWIALLQRGNCTFKEKISRAAFHNAVAVVIYNNKSKEEPVTMTHPGKQKKEVVDFVFPLANYCFIGRHFTSC